MKLGRSFGKGGSRSSVSYPSATRTCLKSERGFYTRVREHRVNFSYHLLSKESRKMKPEYDEEESPYF